MQTTVCINAFVAVFVQIDILQCLCCSVFVSVVVQYACRKGKRRTITELGCVLHEPLDK